MSKGFGFVCFSNASAAASAIKELRDNEHSFPGLPPLYVDFAMKKDERQAHFAKNGSNQSEAKFYALLMDMNLFSVN
jgi:hypothetical protein